MLVIEPLNNIDRVGYSMLYAKPAFELIKKAESNNIKMLYDIYHQNVMGDFSMKMIEHNISKTGYDGYIGLEYKSTKPDCETFGFLKEAGLSQEGLLSTLLLLFHPFIIHKPFFKLIGRNFAISVYGEFFS